MDAQLLQLCHNLLLARRLRDHRARLAVSYPVFLLPVLRLCHGAPQLGSLCRSNRACCREQCIPRALHTAISWAGVYSASTRTRGAATSGTRGAAEPLSICAGSGRLCMTRQLPCRPMSHRGSGAELTAAMQADIPCRGAQEGGDASGCASRPADAGSAAPAHHCRPAYAARGPLRCPAAGLPLPA